MSREQFKPPHYDQLVAQSEAMNFTMCSDLSTGSLLSTLVASKRDGKILEIGTGTGLSLSWILAGASTNTRITSIENDPEPMSLAKSYFDQDDRVELICGDAGEWISSHTGLQFDLIFADAWPGKFEMLEETLQLLSVGGLYFIDDLTERKSWPAGHGEKVVALIERIQSLEYLRITEINWSTGLLIATKTA